METLSRHSDESTRPTAIKNNSFVEANPSFSFVPLMASEDIFIEGGGEQI